MKTQKPVTFENILERYKSMVQAMAYSRVRNFDDARDIAQNVFVAVFLKLRELDDPSKVAAWLSAITLNACNSYIRSAKRTEDVDPMHACADEIRPLLNRLAVEQALQCLSDQTRLTITLFYYGEYSLAEIASFLDIPVTTVKSRLRDGRARLKKEMIELVESTLKHEALDDRFTADVKALADASIRGNDDEASRLLAQNVSLANSLGEVAEEHREYMRSENADHGWTPLHLAAHYGNLGIVKLLIEYGADIEAVSQNSVANTPISAAAWGNQLEIVEYLISCGANVDAPNAWGSTALRRAVAAGRLPLVELLLASGADPGIADRDGTTPLEAAANSGKTEIAILF